MAFDILGFITGAAGDLVDKIIKDFKVDPTVALEKKVELEEAKLAFAGKVQDQFNQQLQGQIDINKLEASNPHIFVAGWRPFVGWICASALALQFIIGPIATWIAMLAHHPIAFPQLNMSYLMTLLGGLLGFGGMRTAEKVMGLDTKNFS